MPLREKIPSQMRERIRKILMNIRDNAVELQDTAQETEGLIGIFLDGVASRIINLIDITLKEV